MKKWKSWDFISSQNVHVETLLKNYSNLHRLRTSQQLCSNCDEENNTNPAAKKLAQRINPLIVPN
jgi:hypothetical protein